MQVVSVAAEKVSGFRSRAGCRAGRVAWRTGSDPVSKDDYEK